MKLGIPQLIMVILFVADVAINLALHGEKSNKEYNFWVSLISVSIEVFILYKGGFFG